MEKKRNSGQEINYFLAADTKPNTAGEVKIYLRFYHCGKKTDHFTGVRWPLNLFDKVNQLLIKRRNDDPDVQAYNLKLGQLKTIAHQLQLDGYMKNKQLTVPMYIEALDNASPSIDFVSFTSKEINRLYNNDVIAYETWRRHRASLNRLIYFWKTNIIPIDQITTTKLIDMDAFYRKIGKAHNTIAGYHKDIKKYLNVAIDQGLIYENPYRKFKFKYIDGDREALTQEEVKLLRRMYEAGRFDGTEKEVLRRFLFSCFTGIRISDTHRVTSSMVKQGVLKFQPKKGLKYGKIVVIPLPQAAQHLISGREGLLFPPCSDKHINFCLKFIAAKAQIDKRLTYHCARDTFGTIFIELGGDIKSCADLMGHSSTKTTAIYLKMSDKRKQNLMNNFDLMFDDDESPDTTDNVPIKRLKTKGK